MNRRRFVKVTLSGGLALVGGCGGQSSERDERRAISPTEGEGTDAAATSPSDRRSQADLTADGAMGSRESDGAPSDSSPRSDTGPAHVGQDAAAGTDAGRAGETGTDGNPGSGGTIDAHVHFWDPSEQPGILYPGASAPPALPGDYARSARGAEVAGVILVEAVWRLQDHDWAFRLAARSPLVLAVVGKPTDARGNYDLRPEWLDKVGVNRLLRGVRVAGSVLGRADAPNFFGALAERGLSLEVQGGDVGQLDALARLWPRLRIIIDTKAHGMAGRAPSTSWKDSMRRLGDRPNVFVKTLGLADAGGGTDVEAYRPILDHLWATIGPERLLFASNWPVSQGKGSVTTILGVLQRYLASRDRRAQDKILRSNALALYGV